MKTKLLALLLIFAAVLAAQSAEDSIAPDKNLASLITAARKYKRDYVIESATMLVKLETSNQYPGQTSAAEVQIVYTIFALTNVTTFDEEYHSPAPNAVVERIPGSDPESKLTDDKPTNKAWNVLLQLKTGERHTLTTKARYTYKLPFPGQRTIRDFHNLPPGDDVWGYPNTEDVIGELTILVQSKLPIKAPHDGDALLADTHNKSQPTVKLSQPSLQAPDKDTAVPNVLAAHWQNVMPGQAAELHLAR